MVVCALATLVRADEESDRRQYIDDIERLLGGVYDDLGRVASDSGPGYVDYAIRKADDVKDKAGRLSSVKGSDSKAQEMSSYYPGYVDKFKESARYLRLLKEGQRALDELPRRCDEATRELVSKMRAYTDSPDPRGAEAVPKLAREYGRIGRDALEQAERKRNEMYQWYDRADDFSESSGKWSDVRSALYSAARSVWEAFARPYETIKRDDICGNLAKEERNPIVEEAMKKLSEGKRSIETLYDAMDRQLGEAASFLNDLESDTSASDIDNAERKAGEVERTLEQLDRIRGQDGEARRRVEVYRNLLRGYRDALKHLRILKLGQFSADRLPAQCRESETKLADAIKAITGRRDPKGVTELPALARTLAEPIRTALAKADEQNRAMEAAKNEASRFDPGEGKWREVRASMKDSIDGMSDHWRRALETSHKSCDELAKGEEARSVKEAVDLLKRERGSAEDRLKRQLDEARRGWDAMKATYQQMESQLWAHINESRKLRRFDVDEMNELIVKMCGQDHERDGDEADRLAQDMAARIVSATRSRKDEYIKSADAVDTKLKQVYGAMRDLQAALQTATDALAKEPTIDATELQPLRTLIGEIATLRDKDREKFFGVAAGDRQSYSNTADDNLKGSNNPRIEAAKRHGRAKHRELQSSFSCDRKEFAAGGGFADCVTFNDCTVWEFKPSSWTVDAARSDGLGYRDDVNRAFSKANGDGQTWEKCWKSDGPTRGAGFEVKGFTYPKCDSQ